MPAPHFRAGETAARQSRAGHRRLSETQFRARHLSLLYPDRASVAREYARTSPPVSICRVESCSVAEWPQHLYCVVFRATKTQRFGTTTTAQWRALNAESINRKMSRKGDFKNLVNQRFGKLVVIQLMRVRSGYGAEWLCRCDCGNQRVATVGPLQQKRITQCSGCAMVHQRQARKVWARPF